MAHLRKKDRWLDHARAMIEGKSLAKTAALCGTIRRRRFVGVIGFCAPCKRQAPELERNCRSGRNLRSRILQGPTVRPAEKGAKARRNGQAPGLHEDNIPILVARDRNGATFDAILAQVDGASVSLALAGIVTPGNHLIGDGGKAIATFARRAGIAFHTVRRRESRPPRRRTCTSTTSTPITAVSSNGSTASTASPPRTCPIISVGGALSKPGATNSNRQAGSKALSETGHTNR